MRLFIVEDHPSIFYLLKLIVKETASNVRIEYSADWKLSLKKIKRIRPEFVITDIQIGDYKQLEIIETCSQYEIPFMVFSSHINQTILQHCENHNAQVVVAKSAPIQDLKLGIQNLLLKQPFRCEICKNISNSTGRISEQTPKPIFSYSEEFVILAQIEGKSTIELSNETKKSKYTIRNQRMKLMQKNDCTMEELVRRYLFWNTKG